MRITPKTNILDPENMLDERFMGDYLALRLAEANRLTASPASGFRYSAIARASKTDVSGCLHVQFVCQVQRSEIVLPGLARIEVQYDRSHQQISTCRLVLQFNVGEDGEWMEGQALRTYLKAACQTAK